MEDGCFRQLTYPDDVGSASKKEKGNGSYNAPDILGQRKFTKG